MSKLRVHSFAVFLDGYGAGRNQSLDDPLGVGGLALHEWAFNTRTFHAVHGTGGGSLALTMTSWRAASTTSARGSSGETRLEPCAAPGRPIPGKPGGAKKILKRRFYEELTEQLANSASIAPSDVMVAIIGNSAADWSFGNGEPQFLTGDRN